MPIVEREASFSRSN